MATLKAKTATVKAPCRIDFAGGTLDLWPLYLYFGGLELVQMGINVKAEAKVRWEPARKQSHSITLSSADLKLSETYESMALLTASLAQNTGENPLRWLGRISHFYLSRFPSGGKWTIETRSDAPPGSGLGGSSTLGIALARAFEKVLPSAKQRLGPWALQQSVRDLEAVEIEHPAGDQDYVPALFGGLLVLKMGTHFRDIERLPVSTAKKLSERCALLYTGKPHHSGLNNWQIFTAVHAKDANVLRALREIRVIARDFAQKLRKKDFAPLTDLLNAEWDCRQRLSNAVRSPELDQAWAFGVAQGAVARKACGAGGGGCLLLMFPDKTKRDAALKASLPDSSWKWLNADVG